MLALRALLLNGLWALEQPPGTLDVAAMVRDTTATLARLPWTRHRVRAALRPPIHDHVTRLERDLRGTLDARDAYNDIPET